MFNNQSMASASLPGSFAERKSFRKPSGSSLPLEPRSLRTILRPLPRPALGWAVGTMGPTDHRDSNTRFIKCVIQCLAHVPGVAETCASSQHRSFCHGRIRWLASGGRAPMGFFCMRCTLGSQVAGARSAFDARHAGHGYCQSTNVFDSEDFKAFGQCTCQGAFIEMLQEAADMERMMALRSRRNLVDECFNGIHQAKAVCRECHVSLYDTVSPFKMVALDVHEATSSISVQHLLEQSLCEKLVTGPHECPQCKKEVEVEHQISITQPPDAMVVQLNRFTKLGRRVHAPIHVDPRLSLAPCMARDSSGYSSEYSLAAVLTHSGEDPSSGVYGAYVRSTAGDWYSLRAVEPYKVKEETVQRLDAFMLFYSRDGAVQPSVVEALEMEMDREAGSMFWPSGQRAATDSDSEDVAAAAEEEEETQPHMQQQLQPMLQLQQQQEQQQRRRLWSFPLTFVAHQLRRQQQQQTPSSIPGERVVVSPEQVRTPSLVEEPPPPQHRDERTYDPDVGRAPSPLPVSEYDHHNHNQQQRPLVALLEIPLMPDLHPPASPAGDTLAPMTPPLQQQQQADMGGTLAPLTPPLLPFMVAEVTEPQLHTATDELSRRRFSAQETADCEEEQKREEAAAVLDACAVSALETGSSEEEAAAAAAAISKLPRKRKAEEGEGVNRLSRTSRTSTSTRGNIVVEMEEEGLEEEEGSSSHLCWSGIFRRIKRARVKLEGITAELDAVAERVELRKARALEFWASWGFKENGQQEQRVTDGDSPGSARMKGCSKRGPDCF